jgi:DNA-binding NtrC family response regulator
MASSARERCPIYRVEVLVAHRLTFLIVEAEPEEGLSTRKLLIETAKHNVITAYNGEEGKYTLERFPAVDAVVYDMAVSDIPCEDFAKYMKQSKGKYELIALCQTDADKARARQCANEVVPANDPAGLLDMLEHKFGLGNGNPGK